MARLLRGLAGPYLQGMIAHAVSQSAEPPETKKSADLPAKALETVVGQLGKAIGETRLPRGMTALTEPPSRPQAGERHQDAIRQMADAYKSKRQAF